MTLVDSPTTGGDADPSPEPTDRAWGAFTESAPWVLEESQISWMPLAERLRDRAQAEVPELTRAGRIPDLRRLVSVVRHLGWAVGVWWVRKRRGRYADSEASRADLSARLRSAIEILGPTYIKLAQIISSGEGLFPAELVDEFKKCRDQVPAEPFEVVRTTVEADLGARLEDVFSEFSREALAAASIAQVHAARLLDGTEVVVKVQRPDVARLVRTDLKVMAIFNINHILDIKITKGKSFKRILGIIIAVKTNGLKRLTSRFLKNSISSNKFKIIPNP